MQIAHFIDALELGSTLWQKTTLHIGNRGREWFSMTSKVTESVAIETC